MASDEEVDENYAGKCEKETRRRLSGESYYVPEYAGRALFVQHDGCHVNWRKDDPFTEFTARVVPRHATSS